MKEYGYLCTARALHQRPLGVILPAFLVFIFDFSGLDWRPPLKAADGVLRFMFLP